MTVGGNDDNYTSPNTKQLMSKDKRLYKWCLQSVLNDTVKCFWEIKSNCTKYKFIHEKLQKQKSKKKKLKY